MIRSANQLLKKSERRAIYKKQEPRRNGVLGSFSQSLSLSDPVARPDQMQMPLSGTQPVATKHLGRGLNAIG